MDTFSQPLSLYQNSMRENKVLKWSLCSGRKVGGELAPPPSDCAYVHRIPDIDKWEFRKDAQFEVIYMNC